MDTVATIENNKNVYINCCFTQAEALTLVTLLRYQARDQRNQNGGVGYEIGAAYERLAAKLMHSAVGGGLAKQVADFEQLPIEVNRIALLGAVVTDTGHALMEARDRLAANPEFGHFATLPFEDVRDLGNSITLMVSMLFQEPETLNRINGTVKYLN